MTQKNFKIGENVKLIVLPPYLKTAEPMPMLRPCDIIEVGEEGVILDRRPGDYWGVKFSQGAFLMEDQYIDSIEDN
jgi:hypothetical protein